MRNRKQKGPVALGGANTAGEPSTELYQRKTIPPTFDDLLQQTIHWMSVGYHAGVDPINSPESNAALFYFAMMVHRFGYERSRLALLASEPEGGR